MTTMTADDAAIMEEIDRELAGLRATLEPEDLTGWDMDTAVLRALLDLPPSERG